MAVGSVARWVQKCYILPVVVVVEEAAAIAPQLVYSCICPVIRQDKPTELAGWLTGWMDGWLATISRRSGEGRRLQKLAIYL